MFNKNYIWLLLLLSIFILPAVSAKSFAITNYDINYTLQENGTVAVSEKLDYQLSGCFKELYLQRPNVIISNPSGYCQGADCSFEYKPTKTISGDPELILKGNYCNTVVTAYFNYNIEQQIKALEDGTQFYYQVYPGKTSVSSNVNIRIFLPEDVNQTTRFIHSKNYTSQITENSIIISKSVSAYEIIEVNILMPKGWFSQDNLYHYPDRNYTQAQVIQEEQNWQQGYTQYTQENVKTETTFKTRILIYFIFFIIPFLLLLLVWLIFGREYSEKRVIYFGMYERDLPSNEDPLQANYLITGKFSKDWFSSAIIYLIWKNQYGLEKRKGAYFLIRNKTAKKVDLPSYIEKINKFLVKYYPDGEIDLDQLKKVLKLPPLFAVDSLSNWSSIIAKRADFSLLYNKIYLEYEQWFHHKSKLFNETGYIIATIVYTFCFIGLFVYLGLIQTFIIPNAYLFFFIALIILILIPILFKFKLLFGRFSKEGRVKNLQWTNFKRYITDFSLMKKYPPKHVILWEEYMVYATAFGVAKEASKALKTAMPEEIKSSNRFTTYTGFSAISGSFSGIGSSTGSAGSGGAGGGFGGGGGGGGGAGAR